MTRQPPCNSIWILSACALALPASVLAQEGDKVITNSIGIKLTLIPAGKFQMGSPATEEERDPEELRHEVTLSKPFYLGVHEITQAQYANVMVKSSAFFKGGVNHPVENVRWREVVDFCSRLSAQPMEKKAGRKYRLPTEAEWEYACRAGTVTPFHFGASLSSKEANFNGNYPFGKEVKGPFLKAPAPVGSYSPNAWGLYDMHGNVAEWCSDWYDPDYYKTSPKVDPKGPAKGVLSTDFGADFYQVVRGGCWLDEARGCRTAYRFRLQPSEPYRLVGFRVVCEVTEGK